MLEALYFAQMFYQMTVIFCLFTYEFQCWRFCTLGSKTVLSEDSVMNVGSSLLSSNVLSEGCDMICLKGVVSSENS